MKTQKTKIITATVFCTLLVVSVFPSGCIESQKSPAPNETEIVNPSVTEQKLPAPSETKPLTINDTFETWSRGYYSNLSNTQTCWVITNYSEWNDFLDNQSPWFRRGVYLEGQIFPGIGVNPRMIVPDDFNNSFIIVATMGLIGHAESDEVEIKNISRINNVVNVTVHMYHFTYGNDVESDPYHIVLVNRSILPNGNSTFVFTDADGKKLGEVEIKE